jgi:uncharacterized protein with LGFP repeats
MAGPRPPTAALAGAPPASIDACGGAAGIAVCPGRASLCPSGTVAAVTDADSAIGEPAADRLMSGLLGDRSPGVG